MHDTCITRAALGGRARRCSPTTKTVTLIMRLLTMRFKCRSRGCLPRSGISLELNVGAHGAAVMENVGERDYASYFPLKIMLAGSLA